MSSTRDELFRMRRAAYIVAALCGFKASVTKQQRLSADTEYVETEWQMFAWSKPNEVAFISISRNSEHECLEQFSCAQKEYVTRLDSQLQQAKEAYENATAATN